MKCQECRQNGVKPLAKIGLIFDLRVRCSKCGAEYQLHKGLSFFISIFLQLSILVSIFYAFAYLESYIVYAGVAVGFVLVGSITLLLPLKKQPGLKFRGG